MKVIEKGRRQKGWAQEFTCTGRGNGNGGCGATLLVEESDLYHTHSSHYDGSDETYTTFECAACGVETDVDVPSSVPRAGCRSEAARQRVAGSCRVES